MISTRTLLASLALIALATNSFADRAPVSIAPIAIKNLASGKNLSVSVFYASGSNPTFSAEGSVPYVRTIMAGPVEADIHADGTAQIPKIDVTRSGFEIPNLIVLVVHPANQSSVNIQNADGLVATTQGPVSIGASDEASPDVTRMITLSVTLNSDKTGVDSLDTAARAVSVTNGSTITVDMAAK